MQGFSRPIVVSTPPPASGDPLDSLLRRSFVSNGDGRFIPFSSLTHILSEDSVRAELSRSTLADRLDDLNATAALVCAGFRRVFAVLVLTGLVSQLETFLEARVSDVDLPLWTREVSPGVDALYRSSAPDTPLGCFTSWEQRDIAAFDTQQWLVSSPIFTAAVENQRPPHFDLPSKTILPFQEEASSQVPTIAGRDVRWGGFATVRRVAIHPAHHNFSSKDFAVKRLREASKEEFKREVGMLVRFSVKVHPHLVTLLATWKHGNDYCLLFPWAIHDVLENWELNPTPDLTPDGIRWLLAQFRGISDGLRQMHNYTGSILINERDGVIFGRHTDIKAENVLLYPDPTDPRGRMVLGDWGCGRFSSRNSTSTVPNHMFRGTPHLRPPEGHIKNGVISRSWDVWQLGCFFLEFLIWQLKGVEGVFDFADARMGDYPPVGFNTRIELYFEIGELRDETIVLQMKGEVTKMFADLHAHDRCPPCIHDLLDFIQDRMLIVEGLGRQRASCDEVYTKLCEVLQGCLGDDAYCFEPRPRTRPALVKEKFAPVPVQLTDAAQDNVNKYKRYGRKLPHPRGLGPCGTASSRGSSAAWASSSSGCASVASYWEQLRPSSAPAMLPWARSHAQRCRASHASWDRPCCGGLSILQESWSHRNAVSDTR